MEDVAAVRLIDADLDDVKAEAAGSPRYLVEWDLPPELTMDTYRARKKAKSPRYAEVPEVAFRRTYVREDLGKWFLVIDTDHVIRGASDAKLAATKTDRAAITGRYLFDVFPDNPDEHETTAVENTTRSLERVRRHRVPDQMPIQRHDIRRPEAEG